MRAARRFRLYGVSERNALAQILEPYLKSWSHDWLGGKCKLDARLVSVDRLAADSKRRWRCLSVQGVAIAYSLSPGFSRRLTAEAGWCDGIGSRKSSPVWEATLFDCIDALAKQILFKALSDCADVSGDEISSVESDDDAAWSTHGSGYVGYEVTLGQESLTFVIGSVVIDALLGPSPCQENAEMLATRMDAVGSGYFKLELVAGAAEVTVGELHVLAPGHVIQLENLMGQPFKLRTVEGHEIGNGYLAACGANKAVHLVRNK